MFDFLQIRHRPNIPLEQEDYVFLKNVFFKRLKMFAKKLENTKELSEFFRTVLQKQECFCGKKIRIALYYMYPAPPPLVVVMLKIF